MRRHYPSSGSLKAMRIASARLVKTDPTPIDEPGGAPPDVEASKARREIIHASRQLDLEIRRARLRGVDDPVLDLAGQYSEAVRMFLQWIQFPGDASDSLGKMREAIASMGRHLRNRSVT